MTFVEFYTSTWWFPHTLSKVAAAPPIRRTGDSAIWAFFTAVTVLVKPVQIKDISFTLPKRVSHSKQLQYVQSWPIKQTTIKLFPFDLCKVIIY